MNLSDIQNNIRDLGAQIRAAATELAASAADAAVSDTDLEQKRATLAALNSRMAALQAAYQTQLDAERNALPTPAQAPKLEENTSLKALRASREYARAFAAAIRTGARPGMPMRDESLKPVYDALTIGGGATPGEDGGFLVPEDIDNLVRERRRQLFPLSELFTVEPTSANSGWRVMDAAPKKGMTALVSEIPASGIPEDDQPAFTKVPFSLTTYGLIVPVSNELAMDETANLFGYLANWFAKKQVITENLLMKTALEKLTAVSLDATDPVAAISRVLNRSIDPALSLDSVILTNQDGYDVLDQAKDANGRPMLQPNPTLATQQLFKGRRVVMASNSVLPTASGAAPVYIGSLAQYATLFMRQPLEVVSTDIGGNAFRTNAIEVRGICRMGTAVFDKEAVVRASLAAE